MYQNITEVEFAQNFVKTKYFNGISNLHQMYVSCFNAVDLGDRYYAKVDDGHRVHNWHTKLFFALLKLGTVNVYVRCIFQHYQDWIEFRKTLGENLAKLDVIR